MRSTTITSTTTTTTTPHHPNAHPESSPKPTLLSLPPELHLQILHSLQYPDRLSLKHTCATFYRCADTSIPYKVAWLVDRRARRLAVPLGTTLGFRSDSEFCTQEVKGIMERRRWHLECRPRGAGCALGSGECVKRGGRTWGGWWWVFWVLGALGALLVGLILGRGGVEGLMGR
ncbi:MAG: hypothetical protein M1829_002646 [Trizodia sp. TS-e1964]|nr:MAG: hypothetical protein M1829_002646 [Trizodia sp. TS-e1964]